MKREELIDSLIESGVEGFLILEPRSEFDYGCVGYNEETNQLIYDYDELFEGLCYSWATEYGCEDELHHAIEDHLSYNTLRSLAYYKNSPLILVLDEEGEKKPYGSK